ncbi:MAG: cupin domain-containing protein [Myxococcaceae bacterium]|nr:cupin domain-containing protein [Myxococcaceae bacterium]
MKRSRHFSLALLAVVIAAGAGLLIPAAARDAGEETVTLLRRQKLPDVPGKEVALVLVTYEPGQASTAHVHSGSVFAFVVESAVTSQLQGQTATTYSAGETWYEPPQTPHLVSRNASRTRRAKLLAILVLDEGAKLKEPLPKCGPRPTERTVRGRTDS